MRHRTTLLAALVTCAAVACVNKSEIKRARASLYDTEFARVYSAAITAVRESYPHFDEDPSTGKIRTAWKQVQHTTSGDDPRARGSDPTLQAGGGLPLSGTEALGTKRYFVRFDVTVAGQRPWRVRVEGHASEWAAGNAEPSPLRGAAAPSWLSGREEALVLAIDRQLRAFAVPAPPEVVRGPVRVATPADPSAFPDVPAAAAASLAELRAGIIDRDPDRIRATLAPDVVWSEGAAPGVDGAMLVLQADPALLAQVAAALDAGCAGQGPVRCGGVDGPALDAASTATGWRITRLALGR